MPTRNAHFEPTPPPDELAALRADIDAIAAERDALVAERDALRAELAEAREQLVAAQRLATAGTVAAIIAHEFNNLLTPVASYAQLALQGVKADKPDAAIIRKALDKAVTHTLRAGRVCTSMLNFVRGDHADKSVTIRSLVDEALVVLGRDPVRDGIALRVQVDPELEVRGDPIQLEQVVLNLLINARQAMLETHANGRGGVITIAADKPDADHVRIHVGDTGPGISPRNLPRIFEPFFTTKRNAEPRGNGLGLHICKRIVETHGGTIEVRSAIGRGTEFDVLLPAA